MAYGGLVLGFLGALYVLLSLYSYRLLHHEIRIEQAENARVGRPSTIRNVEPKVTVLRKREPGQPHHDVNLNPASTMAKTKPFQFDRKRAEDTLKALGPQSIRQTLTAYIEPPLNDTIHGTGDRGDLKNDKDYGTPPEFRIPLPLRLHTPNDLRKIEYTRLQTCNDLPAKFPVDRGLEIDANGETVVWNVGNEPTPDNFPEIELPFCPVEADPFLPWIHDVFPSQDGTMIEFIAHNKRRCRTGSHYTKDVNRLVPQVALMQPVSVQRISEIDARSIAPDLWHPSNAASDDAPRYRLAPLNESAADGQYTRFICRFHAVDFSSIEPQNVVIGETLSVYPYNYEHVAYRKERVDNLLTPKGKDSIMFWASVIRFQCPVPPDDNLRKAIASGELVLGDGTPTLHVDVIPIRTSTRYKEVYLTEDHVGPNPGVKIFDPAKSWGPKNVVPRVEASGRWENIPICKPPAFPMEDGTQKLLPDVKTEKKKPHFLSACLWASTEFKTRGKKSHPTTDTLQRMDEWIEFHLMVGFDHIYLYDNSGAHTNETSLEPIAAKYPGKVTRIEWPSIPCNNNIPAHDSTGERSSQYSAENSCRTRFAPFTEWIAVFDTDEYLVPMGKYTSLKDVVRDAGKGGTQVLSFRSSRGRLRLDKCSPDGNGYSKNPNATFLEAYNCDSAGSPKPSWAERARKQIYKSDYVLYHYVHYSTVTQQIMETYANHSKGPWTRRNKERPPIQRITDEFEEAVMVVSTVCCLVWLGLRMK